jgi:dTDP-4-dehydrorhamnose 3,5-epimerase
MLNVIKTNIPDVLIFEPKLLLDDRGGFYESWQINRFAEAVGKHYDFVQDNHVTSKGKVLRGLHYQRDYPQGKLVRCSQGSIFDVAVDLRKSSPTFLKYVCAELSETNRHQLWIPPGFAHGYLTLSETSHVLYKATDLFHGEDDHTIMWNDPAIGIDWPTIQGDYIFSTKDLAGKKVSDAQLFE